MSLFSYLYQLKISVIKFFSSDKAIVSKQEGSKGAQEVNASCNYDLRLKCKRADQEIQYIKSFTQWPVTEAKKKTEPSALVYLDISRKKRATITQKNHDDNKAIKAIKKTSPANKVVAINKLR